MSFLIRVVFFVCLFQIVEFLLPGAALAWGPGIHTATALLTLGQADQILPSIASIITAFPTEYLYGCLAADFFIGKGRKKKQKNHFHCWNGGFKLLEEARDNKEAAYAYGFLTHLATDVVAHNYFIPNVILNTHSSKRLGHLYWEVRSDYLVGPDYTRLAREILSIDHVNWDTLLFVTAKKEKNGVKAKKRLYRQSVKLSDFFYAANPMCLNSPVSSSGVFEEQLCQMLELSCRLIQDFLRQLENSPCTAYDPMGLDNLKTARGFRHPRARKVSFPAIPVIYFPVDQDLLTL